MQLIAKNVSLEQMIVVMPKPSTVEVALRMEIEKYFAVKLGKIAHYGKNEHLDMDKKI